MKIITQKQQDEFMQQLEKDYSPDSEKPLLIPQNEREYWLFTEIWQRCTDFFNSLESKNDNITISFKPFDIKNITTSVQAGKRGI